MEMELKLKLKTTRSHRIEERQSKVLKDVE